MAKNKENLKSSLVFNIIYQVVNVLSPLIITPKLSRVFGVDFLGVKSYTFSIVYYFSIFGVLGLDMYGQRIVALDKEDIEKRSNNFWTIFIARLGLGMVAIATYLIFIFVTSTSSFEKTLFCCWTIYLVRGMINPIWYLQGIEKYKLISIFEIVSQLSYVVCTFCFINSKDQLPLYIVFFTGIPLIITLCYFPSVIKSVKRVPISQEEMLIAIKESVVYFVPTIATAVYSMVDKTMLGALDTTKISAGLYESTEKLVKVALAFSTSSFTIMRTRMSYLFGKKDSKEYSRYSKIFISLSMMLCWPIMFGIIGISKDFVPIFFGPGFEQVIPLSYLFSLVIPCLTISGLLQAIYIFPFGLQKTMDYYYLIIVTVNVIMNLILIYFWGTAGAIISSVSAELLLAVILIIKSRKDIDVKYIFECSIKYLIASAVMLICLKVISNNFHLSIIPKLLIEFSCAVICYFTICVLLRDQFVLNQAKRVIKDIANRFKNEA